MRKMVACCIFCMCIFFISEKTFAQVLGQEEQAASNRDLGAFGNVVKKLISEDNKQQARELFLTVDPEAIARKELQNEKPRFIRLSFFITETPGLHDLFASTLSDDDFVTIGFSLNDSLSNEINIPVEGEPPVARASSEFAHKYNLLLFYLLQTSKKDAIKLKTFDECRRSLFLSKEEWGKLPLVSRLAIQELISDDIVQDEKQE